MRIYFIAQFVAVTNRNGGHCCGKFMQVCQRHGTISALANNKSDRGQYLLVILLVNSAAV